MMNKKLIASAATVLVLLASSRPVEAWSVAYGGFNANGKSFGVMREAKRYERLVCRSVVDPTDSFSTPVPGKEGRSAKITCPSANWTVLACRENGRCSTLVVGKWRKK